MVNTIRRWILAVFMAVTMVAGLAGGLAHTGAAAVSHSTAAHSINGQLAGFCPPPPYMCSTPKKG